MVLGDLTLLVLVAGLLWHVLIVVAVFYFDLGGERALRSPEERVLGKEAYEREYSDD